MAELVRACPRHPRLSWSSSDRPALHRAGACRPQNPVNGMAESGERKSECYDALETRDPETRERELFAQLPEAIANAMRAPGWARQLAGIDPKSVRSRKALASLPLLRKSDLKELQHKDPPF